MIFVIHIWISVLIIYISQPRYQRNIVQLPVDGPLRHDDDVQPKEKEKEEDDDEEEEKKMQKKKSPLRPNALQ